MAAIMAPLVFKSEDFKREAYAKKELRLIYNAILGDLKQDFGYIGDMGVFPQNLKDLYIQGSQPSHLEALVGSGVYYGWRGPYISVRNSDSSGIIDPYGNYYLQFFLKVNSNSPCDNSDAKCRWFLMSSGKDGAYNSTNPLDKSIIENRDNIYYPQIPLIVDRANSINTIFSTKDFRTLSVRSDEKLIVNIKYTVYYPASGNVSFLESDFTNPASFTVPVGKRIIVVELENDTGTVLGVVKSFVSTFNSGIAENEFIKLNSTFESLNIKEINFSSASVCPVNTCTGLCAQICCLPNMKKCRTSPVWMWFCIMTGCYPLCCGGSGGGTCTLDLKVDSNLNVNGENPKFDLYLEGFDSNGVRVLGPTPMIKNSSSPFFIYNNNSVNCEVKTLRLFSTGGGATLTRNL